MKNKYDVVIIGGGVSGLATAYFLERLVPGISMLLVEERPRLGGWIYTLALPSGQRYEAGPRSLRLRGASAIATSDLLIDCGLQNEVIKASSSANSRYVVLDNKPVCLPKGLLDLFRTPVGRELFKKTLLEPFQGKGSADDETLSAFLARRAPSPLVEKLGSALASGIWGGEADQLSIYHTFPELKQDDLRFGSCLLGRLAALFEKKPRPKIKGMCTLRRGLGDLVSSIAAHLSTPVWTQTGVTSIRTDTAPVEISTSSGTVYADRVIAAVPEDTLLRLAPSLCPNFPLFPFASFASVVMGWEEDCLERPGFGILAPSSEDPHVLGIVLDSCVFPEQSTHMKTRMTVIMGGVRWPEGINAHDEELLKIACSRICAWTKVTKPPKEYAVIRCSRAIPQPAVGTRRLTPYIASWCQKLYAIAPSFGGVSVNQCITSGREVATAVAKGFQKTPSEPSHDLH